jgi:hypothetical protein
VLARATLTLTLVLTTGLITIFIVVISVIRKWSVVRVALRGSLSHQPVVAAGCRRGPYGSTKNSPGRLRALALRGLAPPIFVAPARSRARNASAGPRLRAAPVTPLLCAEGATLQPSGSSSLEKLKKSS